jgi:hypothetical protein
MHAQERKKTPHLAPELGVAQRLLGAQLLARRHQQRPLPPPPPVLNARVAVATQALGTKALGKGALDKKALGQSKRRSHWVAVGVKPAGIGWQTATTATH